jgi:hypothetical protein
MVGIANPGVVKVTSKSDENSLAAGLGRVVGPGG